MRLFIPLKTMAVTLISLLCLSFISHDVTYALPLTEAPEMWLKALRQLETRVGGYTPRTQHLSPDKRPKYLNRLILETSPYLRQHAHNPVEWRPWSAEAFEVARREDKPILLSIGYSTCHWCHVMERESFEDEEIAAYINAHYIAIKVDREERPDLDDVYMKAVQALTGRGGWPMTTLLTPNQVPFFGGTYFPARDGDRGRQRGFLTILKDHQAQYRGDRATLLASARRLSRYISREARARPASSAPSPAVIVDAAQRLAERFDRRNGGFGRSPKFPTPPSLNLLLRYHQRVGDAHALKMLRQTLTRMAWGGIYDHVGGGFHRYSTDARWLVPHFEKMLYDNAQLIPLYLKAARYVSPQKRALFTRIARETLDYLQREMRSPEGLYYSATDADSLAPGGDHPEEGLFFTWTLMELTKLLTLEELRLIMRVYQVTPSGDLDGRNIFNRRRSIEAIARGFNLSKDQLLAQLKALHAKLYQVRARRAPPLRDDKAITAWNGLMISALVSGARHLKAQRPDAPALHHQDLELARETASSLLKRAQIVQTKHPSQAPLLARTYMEGRARHLGVLDDYAYLIQGLLDLFEVSGEARWLEEAIRLQAELDAHFSAGARGGYYMTSDLAERLITRDRPHYDGAEPSGNSVSALNLLRLYTFTDRDTYRRHLEALFKGLSSHLSRGGLNTMLTALMGYHGRSRALALIIPEGTPSDDPMLSAVMRGDWPNTVIAQLRLGSSDARARLEKLIPWLREKPTLSRGDQPAVTAYLCYEGTCEAPTTDPRRLLSSLEQMTPLLSDRSPDPLTSR